ncbi:MAG: carboxypeptidase regulatory-like domain-containing protein [Candidatus Acidiferrales bacterium]
MKLFVSKCAEAVVSAARSRSLRYLAVLFLLLAVFGSQAWAQEATLVGTVTDASGAAVPNATITATNAETGLSTSATTGDDGNYLISHLRIGHYDVKAEGTGFKGSEQKNLLLQVGDRVRIDFQMQVGTVVEKVVVEANALHVQSDSSEISSVITAKQMTDISNNSRTFYNMVTLMPGVSSTMPDSQDPTPVGANTNVSINGQREEHNIYLIDGGESDDRGGAGRSIVMPSQDAISEFRALTSSYDPEYGLSSAGTITMAVKPGQQQFHASAWEYMRNDAFNAIDPFQNTKTKLRFNIYGFNVGGPVDFKSSEKKTFFFYNMEWRNFIHGGSTNQQVPSHLLYGGNFSGAGAPAIHTPCSNKVSATIAAAYTLAGQTLSTAAPSGTCGGTGSTLVPFTGNIIPAALLSSQGLALVNDGIFPADNAVDAHGNPVFRGGADAPTTVREEVARVDHTFNSKWSVFGHWISEQIMQTYATTMWSGDNLPTAGNTFGNPSYSAVAHVVNTVSPTMINEITFNYNGNRIAILPTGKVASPFTQIRIFPGPNPDARTPGINLTKTGANFDLNRSPWRNTANDYQLSDNISWTHGAHQFKVGGSWAVYKKVQDLFAEIQGAYAFDGSFTGNDFADLLLGYAQGYNEGALADTGHWNAISYALYAQDNWRVSRKLTLNLGIRWDGIPHTYEANSRMGNFYPSLWNPAAAAIIDTNGNICSAINPAIGCAAVSPGLGTSPNPILAGLSFYMNGIGQPGQPGVPFGLVKNHWGAFGPRAGFAYDFGGNGKTVLRAGTGVMYERVQGNDMYNAGQNPPFSGAISNTNVLLSDPHNLVAGGTAPPGSIGVLNLTGLDSVNYNNPMSLQYNVGIQRSIFGSNVLSVAYVGNRNFNANSQYDINLPPQGQLVNLVNSGGTGYNLLLPYRGFRQIILSSNLGSAHYDSLQATLNGRVKSDLSYTLNYTYSKAIDPTTNGSGDLGNVSNSYNLNYDMGPSNLDRRQMFISTFIYEIPFLKHNQSRLLKATLGGWEVSGVITAETGVPLSIVAGSGGGSISAYNAGSNGLSVGTNRPNLVSAVTYPGTLGEWFSTNSFAYPAAGSWGNSPRNPVYGPGRFNTNLSLFKNFVFSEARGSMIQFRAETFNTWNHPQWNAVNANFTSSQFGVVTGDTGPRTVQFALRFVY